MGHAAAAWTWRRRCDIWAGLPLLFQPGAEWNYSVATDVLGRVIEVVSGQQLDEFLAARILGPLGMTDTVFYVGDGDAGAAGRALHPGPGRPGRARSTPWASAARDAAGLLSGGGGLIATAADYHRFTQMLLAARTARPGNWTASGCSARARSGT